MACLAAAFGVNVTLVEMMDDILLLLDRDVRSEIKRTMKKELGINIVTGAPLQHIAETGSGRIRGTVGTTELEADLLLAAVGRAPVSDTIHIENTGITPLPNGSIETDETCRTAVPGIYAVGDVNGKIQLAHAATAQGICAAEHAAGNHPAPLDNLVPGVIFTIPEAAVIGTSASERPKEETATAKFHYRGLGKALASGETAGFVKWVADSKTGRLIGAQAVGAHATDLIAEAALAIRHRMTAHDLGSTIHGHPTFSEIWMEAAHILTGHPTHAAPPRKGISGAMSRVGAGGRLVPP
jgi:dihydrolipoamide dehydrogenase